tara:strand:+ start:236 stop:463 length:228 start_codon:yes stop_codon:yes gene_type:complete
MTDEEPRWKKIIAANRKKEKELRGGKTKGGAGKMARARNTKTRCDMCSRRIRRGGAAEKYGLVYCHQCAKDRGLI